MEDFKVKFIERKEVVCNNFVRLNDLVGYCHVKGQFGSINSIEKEVCEGCDKRCE